MSTSTSNMTPSESSSPSKPARHVCAECGRSYKAVETLNRHRKNHSTLANYECDICHASFKRKDLLDRHLHIHSEGHAAAQSSRTQRACARCSRLKTRCDNANPCARCVRGHHECVYNNGTTRASKPASSTRTRDRGSFTGGFVPDSADLQQSSTAVDAAGVYYTPGLGDLGWNIDTSWFESLPPVPPLSFNGTGMPHVDQNANTGMLWDFATMSSPEFSAAQTMSNGANFGLDVMQTQWPDYSQAAQIQIPPAVAAGLDTVDRVQYQSAVDGAAGVARLPQQATSAQVQHDQEATQGNAPTKEEVSAELTKAVLDWRGFSADHKDRAAFWDRAAREVERAFGIENSRPEDGHILKQFIHVFHERFNIRYPFVWKRTKDPEVLPPYLYLVQTSIGAAFGNSKAVEFYTTTIDLLMRQLVLIAMQNTLPDDEGLAVCQSLTFIQASMLFFGHRKSFFALPQQVGFAAVLLARRINLFNEGGPHHVERYLEETSPMKEESRSKSWVEKQLRRRLAMAILRMEGFISILMGTSPLVSFEETNVYIPVGDTYWSQINESQDPTDVKIEETGHGEETFLLSDLVRIALDKDEPFPANLQPYHLENILYGLQSYVWRFSQDHDLGRRLEIDFDDDEDALDRIAPHQRERDMLDLSQRGMADLKNDYIRTTRALRKWKAALSSTIRADHLVIERKILLASYLLYHVSFMRLKADLASLHRIALRCIKDEASPRPELAAAYQWATSRRGRNALDHARSTWMLITTELRRPAGSRAEFNILSSVALLHSAVVVWAYIGVRSEPSEESLEGPSTSDSLLGLRLYRGNNFAVLQSFAKLLKEVQPTRPGVKTSAYHHTVATLAHQCLPLLEQDQKLGGK